MGTKKNPFSEQNLETWYQETISKLYRFTYALLQNREEAEDITQETYFRCLRAHHEQLPPYPYLKQIARNLINDRYRHWQMAQNRSEEQIPQVNSTHEEDWINQALVQELMKKLPPEYRQVLELRVVAGYSRKETALRLGRSEDAIRGLQYRALQALRDLIKTPKENGG